MILDKIFEEKIGIGTAQYIPLFFLSLVDLNDGAQLILSNTQVYHHRLIFDSNHTSIMAFRARRSFNTCFNLLLRSILWFHYKRKVIWFIWQKAFNHKRLSFTNCCQCCISFCQYIYPDDFRKSILWLFLWFYYCNNDKCFRINNSQQI